MGTHEFGKFRPLRVHMIVCPKLFPNEVGKTWSLSSECKFDQTDFTDWISFLRSNPLGSKSAIIMRLSMLAPKAFHHHEKAEKTIILIWMFDDDESFLWYGWQAKGIQPYFQPGPLSEILTITNLWHPEQDLNVHRALVQVSLNKVQHSQSHGKLTLKISGLCSWPTLHTRNSPK